MKTGHRFGRRKFMQGSMTLLGASSSPAAESLAGLGRATAPPSGGMSVLGASSSNLKMQAKFEATQTVWIFLPPGAGFQEQLAARELARGLGNLGLAREPVQVETQKAELGVSDFVFSLSVDKSLFTHPEGYEISQESSGGKSSRVRLAGATPQAVLCAVFDFLERQGAFFGLDGEVYPLDAARVLNLPPAGQPWRAQPRFKVRGLLPWPDFLNCITVFNREEYRAYLEAMVRMRFNTLGIHVYSMANQWTESFLSFEYAGAGHLAFTDTSATNRWGYLPQRTSRYGMGAPDFYDSEVFGTEATTQAHNCFEAQGLAQKLWGEAFRYAQKLGIKTGVGFEPYSVPDEIVRATPPEALLPKSDPKAPGPPIDPESLAARDILEARLGNLLEAYPTVDYVWLWEDEASNWASQKADAPLSVAPFKQAHDFLRRHAPGKRLVISGWGGVVRHFAYFHKSLPEDVIFTSLSDNLGWDPVSEEYAQLAGRERWPIPWLEDDPAMWLPQFHVHRFVRDMDRAETFGCQGLLGIHWRHRIMDANAGFQSRYSWSKTLQPAEYYGAFARALVRPPAAEKLAPVLNETDRDRRILCSFTGEIKDGHYQIHEYSGDYDEAFQFWNGYEPSEEVKAAQKDVAFQLRALTEPETSVAGERLNYITRHVEFLVPYSESWSGAYRLHQVLQQAADLKKQGQPEEARKKVLAEGVPRWLKLAPLVREALLDFQDIVSTRNDLGTLASMHNKYERLALFRLRASMKEFLGDLPPEVEDALGKARQPGWKAALPRVFVPTRPTLLHADESVRLRAIAAGRAKKAIRATLHTRPLGADKWVATPMKFIARRTFEGELKAPQRTAALLDYYVEAVLLSDGGNAEIHVTAPLKAPDRFYTVTLL